MTNGTPRLVEQKWQLEGEAREAAKKLLASMDEVKGLIADMKDRHAQERAEMEQEGNHRCERLLRDVGVALELKDVDYQAGLWTIEPEHGFLVLRFKA